MEAGTTPVKDRQRTGQHDTFWWQGGLYEIKARAEDTNGALGVVEADLYRGFCPPLHVHSREDEAFYILEGEVRFVQGDDDRVVGQGTWVWGPRGVAHTFKVESERARMLIFMTPGGFERMFEEGGTPTSEAAEPPVEEYDPAEAIEMAKRFGFEVVGPQI